MAKIRVNFTLDEEMAEAFRNYCEEKGYKMSTLVERLIRVELNIVKVKEQLKLPKKDVQRIDRELWGIG